MVATLMARNRKALDRELGPRLRPLFSPSTYCLYAALLPRILAHTRGDVLDAGCGTMPFRAALMTRGTSYHSLDIEPRVAGVDTIGDIQHMPQVPSATFDTVFCSEVLEHVPDPASAMAELARVLRPGGTALFSTPFLCRLHEEPFDFFRYTQHGLRALVERAGLEVVEVYPTGSVFSFIGHQVASLVLCSVWHIPVVKHAAFWLTAAMCTFPGFWLDRLGAMRAKLPLGYVTVACKGPLRAGT